MSKRALGKGIDALLVGGYDEDAPPKGTIAVVPVDRIDASPEQPRKTFDEESLRGLADSIREQGVLQPILVEKRGERYLIVAGERRFRAARLAGLAEVPVVARSLTREEKLEISLIENIQREDLDPVEEAEAFRSLMSAMGLSQETLAKRLGKSRSAVANSLRLLNLDPEIRRSLAAGELTPGHARALLAVQNPAEQQLLFRRILGKGLSVREAEASAEALNRGARAKSGKRTPAATRRSSDLADIEQRLIDLLGTKVTLKGTLKRGTIEIGYFSKEDLERIYDLLSPPGR